MKEQATPITIGLATDVGGGTSFSMLRTAAEAYKVLQLRGQNFSALEAMHQITRGNAVALGLQSEIGSLDLGCYGDLVVLDTRATPAMAHRMAAWDGAIEDELFVLMTLGDDRAVRATFVQGRLAHDRDDRNNIRREQAEMRI
jgi:guanine deaminase